MSASQSGTFNVQEFTDLGAPLVGGRLYTYAYGTTTQKTAYTDHAGTIPHTYTSDGLGGQYIALNSRGEVPGALYLSGGSYDLALKTAAGATVWTRRADPVWDIVNDLSTSSGASLVGYLPAGTGAVATNVQTKLRESVSVKDFGAVGDGVTDDTAAIQAALTYLNSLGGGDLTLNAPYIYKSTATLNVGSNTRLIGFGSKLLSTVPIALQALAKSNITVSGLEIEGPGAATMGVNAEDGGINFGNVTSTNGCTNVKIESCNIHGFYTGVSTRYGSGTRIYDSEIHDFSVYGVMTSRNDGFDISRNYIHGSIISTGTNSYCISATGASGSGDTLALCKVSDNKLADVPSWSAFMSHDIDGLIISDNTITNARNGIDVTASAGTTLKNIVISGNYLEGTTTDTWSAASASNAGILVATGGTVGVDTISNVSIVGNVIKGFGRFTNASQGVGGLLVSNAYNVAIVGNTIIQTDGVGTYVAGIFIASTNEEIAISGNIIRCENTKPCIWAFSTTAKGLGISGNVLSHSNAASTGAKIRIESSTIDGLCVDANTIQLGKIGYQEAGTNVIDGVSIAAPYGGRGVSKRISQRFQGAAVTSLAAGATATLGNLTMPDVVIGDSVSVGYGAHSAGVIVYGYVTGTNTVRVELYNGTGSALTKAAATCSVDAWKHS